MRLCMYMYIRITRIHTQYIFGSNVLHKVCPDRRECIALVQRAAAVDILLYAEATRLLDAAVAEAGAPFQRRLADLRGQA